MYKVVDDGVEAGRECIARSAFQYAIEAGISDSGLRHRDAEALREVGRTATEFGCFSFEACPATLAGLVPPEATKQVPEPVFEFAIRFDMFIEEYT